jgi:hypothetical protein
MAANKVVLPAATTNTQMDNTALNPTGTANRQVYHITIVAQGVSIDPDNIYDMLDAQYATIAGEKNTMSRNTWIFNVGPA